ncbi:TPA: beta strand repeat-containing protein, partial [Haemophilus influenzae]
GHDLFINDSAIVDAKEWLLDPDDVSIDAPSAERTDIGEDVEYTIGTGADINHQKQNSETKSTLTNTTLEGMLKRGLFVNITARNKIRVNSTINIGDSGHLTLYKKRKNSSDGIQINKDITSTGGSLTINSDDWVDIHGNITLGEGFLNITSNNSVAFEGEDKNRSAASAQVTAQGTIRLTGENNTFRLNNISLNGTGSGLSVISTAGNLSHKLDGEINISGNVTINQTSPASSKYWLASHDSFWNVTALNLEENARFTFIKYTTSNSTGNTRSSSRSYAGVKFAGLDGNMTFNTKQGAKVAFKLKSNEYTFDRGYLPYQFKANITATGGGSVSFDIHSNLSGKGASLEMNTINISGGTNFTLQSHVRGDDAFKITKDLTINATGSNFTLGQSPDTFENSYGRKAINATKSLTLQGGNITLGGQNSSSDFKGDITISETANVAIKAYNNGRSDHKERTTTFGNLTVKGKLSLIGSKTEIAGNLSVSSAATFRGETSDSLNITGTFTNDGDSEINISQGAVNLGNITNNKSLSITTNAKNGQKSIISGDITNKKGSLNITDNKNKAEIEIRGNISQKEGNLTISSDKINITKQIKIKAGTDEGNSDLGVASNANLTIKTKELKLTQGLNISGFNKAEIVAKDGGDLTIGNNDDSSNTNDKKVTFNNVNESKISAGNHNVTLNSKVETSGSNGRAESNSDNDTGLTINAKNVTVNNNITSHKAVNITASAGDVTTRAGTTINATTGNVEITAQTGNIQGGVESTSGDVTLTATGETLAVGNISGNAVSVTANSGALTTQAGSTIKATKGEANITSATGTIDGTVSGKTVSVTATTDSLTVKGGAKINATEGAATLTATKGTLTTVEGSSINANKGTLVINANDAKLDGKASGDRTVVNATNASGSGSVTAKTSSSVNVTGDLNTINGLNIISENGRNTVRLRGKEIDVKYIQPGVASVEEVIEAKRVLEKVKDLSDEERETLAKLGVSAVRFVEPNNAITINTQNEFTTRPSSQVTISEGKACFSSGNGAAVCTNVADDGQP